MIVGRRKACAILAASPLLGCGAARRAAATAAAKCPPAPMASADSRDRQLFDHWIVPYLHAPLWREASAYNACHHAMVPLHAAFTLDATPAWSDQFCAHFERFLTADEDQGHTPTLARYHYLYLASWFVALSRVTGRHRDTSARLARKLVREFRFAWEEAPAWQWDRPPFRGVCERLEWKLAHHDVARSYYRAIIDDELFAIASAANLLFSVDSDSDRDVLLNAVRLGERIFRDEVRELPDGGWLVQPGAFRDHPEYANHGTPVEDVAWDSSHGHRLALWLRSLEGAAHGAPRDLFSDRLRSLDLLFRTRILVAPSSDAPWYRTNNFMDGRNFAYRAGYASIGDNGYPPFGLSGTLLLGWWSFLGTLEVRDVFATIAEQYPLPFRALAAYGGPGSDDLGNAEMLVRAFAFRELLVRLAAKVDGRRIREIAGVQDPKTT